MDEHTLAEIHATEARMFAEACAEQEPQPDDDLPTEEQLDEWADRDPFEGYDDPSELGGTAAQGAVRREG